MNLHLSFHTIIALTYIIPNIYLFLRIRKLFITRKHRLLYTLIYLSSASIYPVSNLLSENNTGFPFAVLEKVSNFLLPFYLYLFLITLVFDIFLLLNIFLKLVPHEKMRDTGFKSAGLTTVLILSGVIVVGGIINYNTIRTTRYRIEIPSKSAVINHLKIAFVADFHLKENSDMHFVEKFVKSIEMINPDLMIFGGDIVEGDREDENMAAIEKLLTRIKPPYGVFGVLGNHEYYAGQDKGSFFNKAGMKILCDSIVVIDSSFSLAGRYDSHFRSRKSVDELLKPAGDNLPVILIDHRPTEIDQVSRSKADVQLSGHTHNGQLFPINLITKKVYELSWGHRKIGNTDFFVTSGISLWGPHVRTAGKSEIMIIDISFTR